MSDTSLMQFPCDFQIKVIGEHHDHFQSILFETVKNHFPNIDEQRIKKTLSKNNQYAAYTLTLYVLDKPSLDTLYQALTRLPGVKWVL